MHWILLIISAALEAVWATALGASNGFTEPIPTVIFILCLIASMFTLGYVTRGIPITTAYAVWAGLGAALTVTWGMVTGEESASLLRLSFIAGVALSVVGLKLVTAPKQELQRD